MNLLRLLNRLGPKPLFWLAVTAAASALSSTVVLAIVNSAAERIAESHADFVELPLAAAFATAVVLYMLSESWMVARMATDVETVVDRLRMRLTDQLRHSDLLKLERFGQTALFDSITGASQTISQNSQFLALTLRSALLTVTILIYIATVSPVAFLLILLLLAVGTVLYIRRGIEIEAQMKALDAEEAALFESVSDLFDGFKEQRLDSALSRGLNQTFIEVSERTVVARDLMHRDNWAQYVFGETAFNLMLGLVIFVVPRYSTSFAQEIAKVSTAVLFMASPVFGLMQSLAVTRAAEGAAGRMLELEGQIGELAEPGSDAPGGPVPDDFSLLRMEGVTFTFPAPPNEIPFSVGPVDLTIRRGEVVFVTGGNGSGKSTFIRLLTGLYHPAAGRLLVDDVEIGPSTLGAYRELMATVFSDFRLFARLYGLPSIDPMDARTQMRRMGMDHITTIDGDRFARQDLSAGQRKRLALVAALLEHKRVLILDEWAADQDPQFRLRFYREILPDLKRQGLTIVAVTHDDHYFDVADRRLHMEDGRLVELPVPAVTGGVS
ncbi:cyclic peptide export ABC transporter [Telmatospirillum sp.]|uniref:cyclic peptide export ABC transporter n=1 Tax=Telmatospirillum sp. TaxID=2079197 RepID=UPI00283F3606|nr:cyclic peptide export ABC transporter [Telmatospirillum sp.]MDR3436281.1 cyclic peptide export ABC transporter [Telmatospirillum sp.]